MAGVDQFSMMSIFCDILASTNNTHHNSGCFLASSPFEIRHAHRDTERFWNG
jgi:hypothetical protein